MMSWIAFLEGFASAAALIAAVLAFMSLSADRTNFSASLYIAHCDVAMTYPELANPELAKLDLRDRSLDGDKAKFERYEWYVARLVYVLDAAIRLDAGVESSPEVAFAAAHARYPEAAIVWYVRGEHAEEHEDAEAAIDAYQRALELAELRFALAQRAATVLVGLRLARCGEVDALSGDPDRRCGDVEGGFGEAAAERQRQQEDENEGGAHGGSFRSRAMRRAG